MWGIHIQIEIIWICFHSNINTYQTLPNFINLIIIAGNLHSDFHVSIFSPFNLAYSHFEFDHLRTIFFSYIFIRCSSQVTPFPHILQCSNKNPNLKSPRPLKLSLPLLLNLKSGLFDLRASRTISFKSTLSSDGKSLHRASPQRGSISCKENIVFLSKLGFFVCSSFIWAISCWNLSLGFSYQRNRSACALVQ